MVHREKVISLRGCRVEGSEPGDTEYDMRSNTQSPKPTHQSCSQLSSLSTFALFPQISLGLVGAYFVVQSCAEAGATFLRRYQHRSSLLPRPPLSQLQSLRSHRRYVRPARSSSFPSLSSLRNNNPGAIPPFLCQTLLTALRLPACPKTPHVLFPPLWTRKVRMICTISDTPRPTPDSQSTMPALPLTSPRYLSLATPSPFSSSPTPPPAPSSPSPSPAPRSSAAPSPSP